MITFESDTADEVWQQVTNALLSDQRVRSQSTRCGPTKELLHVGLTVRDPRHRWVVSRNPAISPAFAIADLVWIIGGRNDSAFPNCWNPSLPRYAGAGERYHGAYGHRLRSHFGLDQLQRAYDALRVKKESRQIVLQIWDASADLPTPEGNPSDPDVPCNICSLLKVREGVLEWMQVIRSNDVFLGVPYNFVQFMSLQEILAGWLGLGVGSYNQVSDSLHLYDKDLPALISPAAVSVTTVSDSLRLPRAESIGGFKEVERRMDLMLDPGLGEQQLIRLGQCAMLPSVFQNMLAIVAAHRGRTRGWRNAVQRLVSSCTDPTLATLWHRWSEQL